MDPVTVTAIGQGISAGANALLGGPQTLSRKQQWSQYLRDLRLRKAPVVTDIATTLAKYPLADKAAYLLQARMGAAGQNAFVPRDVYNPQQGPGGESWLPPGMQAPDAGRNALAGAAGTYTPGAGGFDPDVLRAVLGTLGFNSDAGQAQTWGTANDNADPDTQDSYSPAAPTADIPSSRPVALPNPKKMGALEYALALKKAQKQNRHAQRAAGG